MFVGRKKELNTLFEIAKSNKFEFGILYGRRRIGKTLLLKEMLKVHRGIYFVATEMDLQSNIEKFSEEVAKFYQVSYGFKDLESIFSFLIEKSKIQRTIVIIDEFTYLFSKDVAVQSVLQKIVDSLINSNIVLILSGSQVGLIEEVISYKKPLFGRTTFKIKLESFNYLEAQEFYKNYSNEDKIRAYSIFGGIPHYLSKIDNTKDLEENVINIIIKPDGALFQEVEFFLKQELRSINAYQMIIHAIAAGATRLNDISTMSNIGASSITSNYIKSLIELEIITKEICFGENENSKKTLYKIEDNFFNFYYRYIANNRSAMTILEPQQFYDLFVKDDLDCYVSLIFENICKEFLIYKNKISSSPFYEIGRYWGNNHRLKTDIEIDIVTKGKNGVTVYECKWTNDLIRSRDYNNLSDKASHLKAILIGGFSKSGFSAEAKERFDLAYHLDDLFKPL